MEALCNGDSSASWLTPSECFPPPRPHSRIWASRPEGPFLFSFFVSLSLDLLFSLCIPLFPPVLNPHSPVP